MSSPRGFLGWSNAPLLDDGRTRIAVDAGVPGDMGTSIKRMQEIGLDPGTVAILVLMHLHFEHCCNVDLFPNPRVVLGAVVAEPGTRALRSLFAWSAPVESWREIVAWDRGYAVLPRGRMVTLKRSEIDSPGRLDKVE